MEAILEFFQAGLRGVFGKSWPKFFAGLVVIYLALYFLSVAILEVHALEEFCDKISISLPHTPWIYACYLSSLFFCIIVPFALKYHSFQISLPSPPLAAVWKTKSFIFQVTVNNLQNISVDLKKFRRPRSSADGLNDIIKDLDISADQVVSAFNRLSAHVLVFRTIADLLPEDRKDSDCISVLKEAEDLQGEGDRVVKAIDMCKQDPSHNVENVIHVLDGAASAVSKLISRCAEKLEKQQ